MTSERREPDLGGLEAVLGVTFNDRLLLKQALIHKSWAVEHKSVLHNERLEFLGDSVLALIVAGHLYHQHPEWDEGKLSKLKSVLVSKQQISGWARDIGLPKYIIISSAEESSGGKKKDSILANIFEAVLGAMYLDRGLDACKEYLHERFLRGMEEVESQDYKSILQEVVQKKHKILPVYEVVEESGPDHDKRFVTVVRVEEKAFGRGTGKTKKQSEQAAAKSALRKLQK